jgi:geranylgeranyl diphosphate synthase type I
MIPFVPARPIPAGIEIPTLIAETEEEILGLDGTGARTGKRMRPLLGLLAYASITGEFRPALPGAAAVELGHNFSLVHDDIEDSDTQRHNRPTLWSRYGIPQAINTGDAIFSLSRIALHRLSDLGFSDAKVLRLMRLYDTTCLALCEGQYIDIWTSEHDEAMSVDLYFDMIGRKTASLIAASIEAGAILATDDDDVIARYRGFGWALGIAFQLNDDLLGIWGEAQATGKEASDLAKHKKTLPVLYALEHGGPEDVERLRDLQHIEKPTADDVAEAVGILERSGARDYARTQARRYRDEALRELDAAGVVDPEARQRLEAIIRGVIAA